MTYKVIVQTDANRCIEEIYSDLLGYDPAYAERWMHLLQKALDSLQVFPNMHPYAPENAHTNFDVRQLWVGKYRVIFAVRAEDVRVLLVRHVARGPVDPAELN